jgi:hypothetical protein
MEMYLHHPETGTLVKLFGDKLTIFRERPEIFLVPGSKTKVYEVLTVENITPEYVEALCKTNIHLGRREWKEKVTALIHKLVA